jgi:putative membrane protein insertion efficiency factor
MKALFKLPIHLYRWFLSPFLGRQCRFHPTCSAYALEAIDTHGVWRGGALALKRRGRCQPWGGAGHDPVPEARHA